MSKKRGSLDGLIGVTIRTSDDHHGVPTEVSIVGSPYTDAGQSQIREAYERSGHFVPGTVKVKVVDGRVVMEGVLKGRIHEITIDGSIDV